MTAAMRSGPRPVPAFLDRCGDTGRRIASIDWSRTPLGPIPDWPPCLRVTLSATLRSPVAMALLWGPDGIMLYNDAYAVVAGQRHPSILGKPVTEAWPEVADFSLQAMRTCLGGESLAFKDRRLTLCRNGAPEDVWLDLGCSPVFDEAGQAAGVMVVVVDTTDRNLADERLRIAQEAGRVGTFEWFPQSHRSVVSDVYRQIWGLAPDEDVTDARLLSLVLPEDRDQTGNLRFGRTANPLSYSEYRIHHQASGEIRWIARRGELLEGGADTPQRLIGAAWDITERKTAERQDAFLATLGDKLRDLTDAREVVGIASEMLARYLGANRAGYAEIDPDAARAVIDRDWTDQTVPSLVGRHDIEAFGLPLVNALRRGETYRLNDTRSEPLAAHPGVMAAYERIGMRSGITVPLIRDARFAGVLFAHCAEPRAWTDNDEAVMHAVAARTWDTARRAQAEQRLRDSEENFRLLAQAMPIQAWLADPQGQAYWVNEQAYAYTGAVPGDLLREDWIRLVHPDDRGNSTAIWTRSVRDGTPYEFEHRILRHDGAWRWHLVRAMPIRDAAGRITRWIGTNTDIEDQRRVLTDMVQLNAMLEERVEARTRQLRETEAALRQAQKMEAIGQLTGGIAHDFNNLLTGIIGSLELVRRRMRNYFPGADGCPRDLDRFIEAATVSAQRAAALTHRLLAFARRQALDTRPTDVAALAQGMAELLRRTLGEQVNLRIDASKACWHALTDPNQLESAILNLAINARDAMPEGGHLAIGAANVVLDPDAAGGLGQLEPGAYVAISVTDTGTGMPDEVKEKAFDPFFTTKPTGQGTGLGLSMVYGFARQSGGHAHIASRFGHGTTVTLYLPRAAAEAEARAEPGATAPGGDGETVLVVEDVPSVRMLIVEVLNDLGYRTIEATDASEALPVLGSSRPIDLLVSDVGLPGLNGRQIADYARTRRPGLKVLFVTGYAGEAAARVAALEPGMAIITKPFAIDQLASKIREMLNADAGRG